MYRENLNISEFNVLANTRVEPGIMVREHWHDAYELLYVHSGVCEQTVGGATRALDAGCITLVAPRDTHATTATGKTGADIYLVQFTQRFIGDARLKSALIPAPPSAHWEAAFDELYAQNARDRLPKVSAGA